MASTSNFPKKHSVLKIFLILVALVSVVALVLGTTYGVRSYFNTSRSFGALDGLLVMAVTDIDTATLSPRITPVAYYFADDVIEYVPADMLAESPDGFNIAYQHSFSGDGSFVTFVGAADVTGMSVSEAPLQIYRADFLDVANYDDFMARLQSAERITSGLGEIKQEPSISNFGDVLYSTHAPKDPEALLSSEAEEWDIHLVVEGEDTVITSGVHPKWVSEDMFLFLKNDGLYIYHFEDKSEQKVWGMQGTASALMALDVSDNRQLAAWTAPEAGEVYVIQANDWDTGDLTLLGTIPIPGTAATFSPDGRFLAIETAVQGELQGQIATSIELFDVVSLERAGEPIYLPNADPAYTYLTDWRP